MRAAVIGLLAVLLVVSALAVDAQRTPQHLQLESQDVAFQITGTYTRTAAESPPLCLPDCAGTQHEVRLEVAGLPDLPLEARLDGQPVPLDAIASSGSGPGPARLQLAWIDGPAWYDVPLRPGTLDEAVRIPLLPAAPTGTTEQLGSIFVAFAIDLQYEPAVPAPVELHVWLDGDDLGVLDGRFEDRLDRRSGAIQVSIEPAGTMPSQPTFVAWA